MSLSTSERSAIALVLAPCLMLLSANAASASMPAAGDDTEQTIHTALAAAGQELTAAEASAVPDSVAVRDNVGSIELGDAALAVTALDADDSLVLGREDGMQALTVLDGSTSTAEFRVDIPEGAVLVALGEGFDVRLQGEGFSLSIAQVAAPWAIDADGRSLPTSYELVDGVITQHVDLEGASLPVVADPLITIGLANAPQGPGPYLNLTGQVMNSIYAGVLIAVNLGPSVVCVSLHKIPEPRVRGIATALCGLFGASTVSTALGQVAAALRASSWRSATCYQMRVPGPGPFVSTSSSNCA